MMSSRPSPIVFAVAVAVVVFQLACPLMLWSQAGRLASGGFARNSDAANYLRIVEKSGTPYRDFEVAYPPLAFGLFRSLRTADFADFSRRLLLVQVACQAAIVFLLFKVWGKRAMWSYLLLSAPMLFIVYVGFDLEGVALAVAGAALIRKGRPLAGGLGFVVGAFVKLWPVVVLPALLVRREVRAGAAAIAVGVIGLATWILWGGTDAVGQVVTYRGARGWEYESAPGEVLRLVTRDALRFEAGAIRVGAPPRVLSTLLTIATFGVVGAIWWMASRSKELPDGLAETAAITAVLVFGTLLSTQFLIWVLPFVAIAAAAGAPRLIGWAGAATIAAFVYWILAVPEHIRGLGSELAIIGRNGALIGLLTVSIAELYRASRSRAAVTRG
jgi:hypothetical protein